MRYGAKDTKDTPLGARKNLVSKETPYLDHAIDELIVIDPREFRTEGDHPGKISTWMYDAPVSPKPLKGWARQHPGCAFEHKL